MSFLVILCHVSMCFDKYFFKQSQHKLPEHFARKGLAFVLRYRHKNLCAGGMLDFDDKVVSAIAPMKQAITLKFFSPTDFHSTLERKIVWSSLL